MGGSRVGRAYREFLAVERMSRARYGNFCAERLRAVLDHATKRIPYYRERLTPGASLHEFPVLTKEALREGYRELMSDRLRGEVDRPHRRTPGYGWVLVQSGGTTGSPTTVVHDAAFRDAGRASRMYSQYLCGFSFGTPYTMLWGSMRDIGRHGSSLPKRVLNGLARVELLNAFQLNDDALDKYLGHLSRRRVRHLMAYVDAADILAGRALALGRHDVRLESIMACAGTVTDGVRARLRDAFGARTHNKYGSRECTDMACECDRGSIHVYGHHVHLEIVDASGSPVRKGEVGRVLVTLLGNDAFPMIRYDIGDLAKQSGVDCECQRPLPTIEHIEGRAIEALTDERGMYVSPVFLRHVIGVVHNPGGMWRRFQVRQRAAGEYKVLLEPAARITIDAAAPLLSGIRHDLAAVLGRRAVIDCAVVPRIAEEPSGKFLYVVNEVGRSTPSTRRADG